MRMINILHRKFLQLSKPVSDLVIIGLIGGIVYLTVVYFDLFESLLGLLQQYEAFELDEIILLICTLSICFSVYSRRRWLEYKTELKRRQTKERSLILTQQKLRNLSERIDSIREEERRWVALALNEDVAQILATIKLEIEQEIMFTNSENATNKEQQVFYLKNVLDKLQYITKRLRPAALDHLNFLETVFWFSRDFQERTGIKCRLELAGETTGIDEDVAYELYRILEEVFTNVEKHALADQISLKIRFNDKQIHLVIEDNGCGIRQDQMTSLEATGMTYIQERIYRLDGSFNIVGIPDKGTFISIKVPLDQDKKTSLHHPVVYEDSLLEL